MAALPANVLLVGGGHAHALLVRGLARRPLDAAVTLVSETERSLYSGMLPGHVAGEFRREEIEIDVARLARAAGMTFVRDRVRSLDPVARIATLEGGGQLAFDVCSLNVGAAVPPRRELLAAIERLAVAVPGGVQRVVVAGAGAGGVEIALALARRFGDRIRLTLYGKAPEPTPEFPPAARRILRRLLTRAGVTLRLGEEWEEGRDDADHVLVLTGAEPPAWLAASGLQVDHRGYVLVDETLRSPSHPLVFGAGDAVVMADHPRPRAGVFAVRSAAPLEANLRAATGGGRFRPFVPQRTYLALLATGRDTALAVKGPFVLHGRALRYLKNQIDRAFVRSLS